MAWNPSKTRGERRARAQSRAAELMDDLGLTQEDNPDLWEEVQAVTADAEELHGRKSCDQCGEPFTGSPHEEVGEFVNPAGEHKIVHAQCGLDADWELA